MMPDIETGSVPTGKAAQVGAVLEFRSIFKSFGGVQALRDVSFKVGQGEVHALAGENGAGKSTLIRICSGIVKPDSGDVILDGRKVTIRSPSEAEQLGISVIHQEVPLCPNLPVFVNVFLASSMPGSFLRPDVSVMLTKTRELFETLDVEIDPRGLIGDCSIAEQQLVMIAKALRKRARLLIMDEPTSALSQREVSRLFEVMRRLKDQGVTFLFVSHRLEEILNISDRVSVLKDGEYVGTLLQVDATEERLTRMIVGRDPPRTQSSRDSPMQGPGCPRYPSRRDAVLEVRNLSSERSHLRNINLRLYRGEVLGLAGLRGSGRTELAHCLFGLSEPDSGEILLHGRVVRIRAVSDAIGHRIGYLTEDRRRNGLLPNLDVENNVALTVVDSFQRGPVFDVRQKRMLAETLVRSLGIVTPSVRTNVSLLSGGNQQKVLFAKWLAMKPEIMILDEPTRGVDVGAKSEIRQLVRRLAADGLSVIVISSEIPELLSVSDRIVCLREGRVVGELPASGASKDAVLSLIMSGRRST